MISRQHIVPAFFDEAEEMRRALDAVFADAYTENYAWQYFHVPDLYCYLRARPEQLCPRPLVERFSARLRSWSLQHVGMVPSGPPMLHLMVNGCSLGLHSDFHNGAFGYVFSLTHWEGRNFTGGETLLLHDEPANYKRHQAHGEALYRLFTHPFNQLLIFDDRIVHATQAIQGSNRPGDGRLALVGHLRAASPTVEGALAESAARKVIRALLERLSQELRPPPEVHGPMSYRLAIDSSGTVSSIEPLANGLVTQAGGYQPSPVVAAVEEGLEEAISELRFPAAATGSSLIFSTLLPVPDLNPIQLEIRHRSTAAEAARRLAPVLKPASTGEGGESIALTEPLAGTLRIEPDRVLVTFDAPMWVPSQRAQFEATLRDAITRAMEL